MRTRLGYGYGEHEDKPEAIVVDEDWEGDDESEDEDVHSSMDLPSNGIRAPMTTSKERGIIEHFAGSYFR